MMQRLAMRGADAGCILGDKAANATLKESPVTQKKKRKAEAVQVQTVMDMDPTSTATRARTSASSQQTSNTATLLAGLFAHSSSQAATAYLSSKSCTKAQRKALAELAGLENDWCNCDQKIAGNVADLAEKLVSELYEPFWFYRVSQCDAPRGLFHKHMATPSLRKGKQGFWMAPCGVRRQPWLGSIDTAATFDAVVHFVQAGSGTGVHVGHGLVLTCAHVVDARDDEAEDEAEVPPVRVGRQKVVMFPSGRTFVAECSSAVESIDGAQDVATVTLGVEIELGSLPTRQGEGRPDMDVEPCDRGDELPTAVVADSSLEHGEKLFCVGNPSNVDLESLTQVSP